MAFKAIIIADLHFSEEDPGPLRRLGRIADILFERAANRINRAIQPDVVILAGDLLDRGDSPGAERLLQRLRSIGDKLACPVIALPGNHDDARSFYRVFPPPRQVTDISGVRFLVFLDPEEPEYNARRTPQDLVQMARASSSYDGPVVTVQHCALHPPGSSLCPSRYVNAGEVIAMMRRHGVTVSVSGHWHPGADLIRHEAGSFIIAPALCESPFPFLEVNIDGRDVSVTRHELRLPAEHGLVDCHVHTPFAYCNEDMDLDRAVVLAETFGLAGLVFCEHSGQLYYDSRTYWSGAFRHPGPGAAIHQRNRMTEYLAAVRERCPPAMLGLEVDCDYTGRPVLRSEDGEKAAVLVGAVHKLPELDKPEPDIERASDEFLSMLDRFLDSGISVLAHPFRVFSRSGLEVPASLLIATVELLHTRGVAAEVNFHTNEPSPDFVRLCVESGVKLTFGSDAHTLCAVGELSPHLELLRQCGYGDPPQAVLADIAFRRS